MVDNTTRCSLSPFSMAIFPGRSGPAGTRMSPFCILLEWLRWWWQLQLHDVQSSSQIIITNKPTPGVHTRECSQYTLQETGVETLDNHRQTDNCICSRLFSVLGVWFWLGLQLRLELVLKVSGLGLPLGLRLVLVGLDVVWEWKIAPVVYIFVSPRWKVTSSVWFSGFKYFIQYYYKLLCVLVHRCLNRAAPQYLSELIQLLSDVDSRRRLFCIHGWSSGDGYVALNHRRPCFPQSWNNLILPVDLHLSRTFTTVKTHLKSHLLLLHMPL